MRGTTIGFPVALIAAAIVVQRNRIGDLLGQVRELQQDLPAGGVQPVLLESHTLKTQVRQMAQDNRRLEERLTRARDNNRFLDSRIATLEAELLKPTIQ